MGLLSLLWPLLWPLLLPERWADKGRKEGTRGTWGSSCQEYFKVIAVKFLCFPMDLWCDVLRVLSRCCFVHFPSLVDDNNTDNIFVLLLVDVK